MPKIEWRTIALEIKRDVDEGDLDWKQKLHLLLIQIADPVRHMPAGPGIGRHHRASSEDNLLVYFARGKFRDNVPLVNNFKTLVNCKLVRVDKRNAYSSRPLCKTIGQSSIGRMSSGSIKEMRISHVISHTAVAKRVSIEQTSHKTPSSMLMRSHNVCLSG